MKFILDENLPCVIAKGFRAFGEKLDSVKEVFGTGMEDTELIPKIGQGGWIFITNDKKIKKQPQEAKAIIDSNVSILFIDITPKPDRWGWIEFFVKNWLKWKKTCEYTQEPFAFKIKPNKIVQITFD